MLRRLNRRGMYARWRCGRRPPAAPHGQRGEPRRRNECERTLRGLHTAVDDDSPSGGDLLLLNLPIAFANEPGIVQRSDGPRSNAGLDRIEQGMREVAGRIDGDECGNQ